MIINAGDEAKLVCTATTDPEELENLKIKWLRDGATINYALAQRIFQNSLDNSLTITNAQKTDTAVYSCVAESSLDKAEATAFITVRGEFLFIFGDRKDFYCLHVVLGQGFPKFHLNSGHCWKYRTTLAAQ